MKLYFATQIYQKKITFDLPDLINEIALIQKADHQGRNWSKTNYRNGYTSYGSMDRLHEMSSTFEQLRKKIDKHVNQYLKNLDYKERTPHDLKMTTCWVNIMPAGAQHTAHIHPLSVISGTFYVAIPNNASAIKFEDPRFGLFMNSPLVSPDASESNLRFISLNPKAGDVVLFESWLKHEVPTNMSKTPRISVSFNYGWS